MEKQIVLITKDAFGIMNLPLYGNTYWKTPNIDELAKKGTVFMRHYTVAPSTGMAITGMFTAKYPYQFSGRRSYAPVKKYVEGDTLFDILEEKGYSNHVIWDECFESYAFPYANCFGKNDSTVFHDLPIREPVGPHKRTVGPLQRDDRKTEAAMNRIYSELDTILSSHEKAFIWIHLPHVIAGRTGYGSDVDTVDELVGWVRNKIGDNGIYISADHGHMDMVKGKVGYAFDMEETAIRVPLITPRVNDSDVINYPTSLVDLRDIILNRSVPKRKYVIADSQYFAQPNRKIAIISGRFKYEYDKYDKKEYLYDVCDDFYGRRNLLIKQKYDADRLVIVYLSEVSFYPYEAEAEAILPQLRKVKDDLWQCGGFWEEKKVIIKKILLRPKLYCLERIRAKKQVEDFSRYER